ncbi:Hsp70 family protein [Peredibacter starrii]|uniref:Hsp70 family protein n=1 Tax=Peredibacter starrii TaxID=28202 RepID=A0AAX4HJS3_9BACT|nr:Hsp70 family protein [Peredibacter starrii]WPU63494.1 Hsp70 family protein [Peredibacter starrii]
MSYHAVDFGTSNSLLSYVSNDGKIVPIPLDINSGLVLRSLIYTPEKNKWFFGNEAISEYVNHEGEGRFFRSIKKFLPEPGYTGTSVFNRNMNISEMVAVFLGEMRRRANKYTNEAVDRIILGRPALYSLDKEQDQLAEDRMRKGAELAGYKEIIFCPEPVAAGLDYTTSAQDERVVLITDFGGGTSDFTLMKVRHNEYSQDDILGLSGIFVAGDVLDGVMMRDFIAPHFGSQYEYQIPGGTNILKFPKNLLKKICSPAHITHLREKDTWEFLQHINKFALSETDQTRMRNLFTLVECQLGFPLFHEIEKTKIGLGKSPMVDFHYNHLDINITQPVSQAGYRESVTLTVNEVMDTMMEVFAQSGLTPDKVDQVIMTGGTSQFPLIQERLKSTFGPEKLKEHNIYQSVVNGLAQYAIRIKS